MTIRRGSARMRTLNTDYLIGLGTIEQRMLILVDIEKMMSGADLGLIEKLAA
jgi:purine-binding chemotaxis protein CheW